MNRPLAIGFWTSFFFYFTDGITTRYADALGQPFSILSAFCIGFLSLNFVGWVFKMSLKGVWEEFDNWEVFEGLLLGGLSAFVLDIFLDIVVLFHPFFIR